MAEGVNVRFSGALKEIVEARSDENRLYNSVNEYIRDLVRREYAAEESRKWDIFYKPDLLTILCGVVGEGLGLWLTYRRGGRCHGVSVAGVVLVLGLSCVCDWFMPIILLLP